MVYFIVGVGLLFCFECCWVVSVGLVLLCYICVALHFCCGDGGCVCGGLSGLGFVFLFVVFVCVFVFSICLLLGIWC